MRLKPERDGLSAAGQLTGTGKRHGNINPPRDRRRAAAGGRAGRACACPGWGSFGNRRGKRQRPSGALLARLEKDFGSYDRFADAFAEVAVGQFASGWAWLVERDGRLQVMNTPNAETPMAQGIKCLLTVDVWEHAYYVDYRNERERYVSAVMDRLNWEFAERNL